MGYHLFKRVGRPGVYHNWSACPQPIMIISLVDRDHQVVVRG